jgi:hypothetical protein
MNSEAGIKKYIYEWLVGLDIGPVFQDRKPLDDTTKLRSQRTYIVYDFPNGIEDQGPWYYGICSVCIGCRDKARFVADLSTLDKVCAKFLEEFPKNDLEQKVSIIGVEFEDDYSDGVANHEYQYSFEVYASKN